MPVFMTEQNYGHEQLIPPISKEGDFAQVPARPGTTDKAIRNIGRAIGHKPAYNLIGAHETR